MVTEQPSKPQVIRSSFCYNHGDQERGGADPSEHAQASRLRELARTVAEYVDGNGADDYPLWAAIEQIAQIGRQEA